MQTAQTDVAVIGAGPAGSLAATLLRRRGHSVTVIERSRFPRFSIGESLLPQCMDSLEQAGLLQSVEQAGFQVKRGVSFIERGRYTEYDFADCFTPGWTWTWHVVRADFDHLLAREAQRAGAEVRYGESIETVDFSTPGSPRLTVAGDDGGRYLLDARFVCDASGFGRVLPRLLELDRPTDFPPRAALFTHVEDRIDTPGFARDRILVCIDPERADLWYWLIPFSGGRASVGVVGPLEFMTRQTGEPLARLQALFAREPGISDLLANAVYDSPVRESKNFAVAVDRLQGRDYALLGNASEFIDPIFSSGVTLAMRSSVLAAEQIDRQLRGVETDWQGGFEEPLRDGLRVFRGFVEAWYSGDLRHVFFSGGQNRKINHMICSVLAGYVWDRNNPYVTKPQQRLRALCQACAP